MNSQRTNWTVIEAREFGENLCEKTATGWAAAQLKDETSKIAVEYMQEFQLVISQKR